MPTQVTTQVIGRERDASRESVETARQPSTCSPCPMALLDVCVAHAPPQSPVKKSIGYVGQDTQTVPRRRVICREQDLIDHVLFMCEGWAASLLTLSDGNRQILSFLLPGDIVSSMLLFQPRQNCVVESITDVRFRAFDRAGLGQCLFSGGKASPALSSLWIEEKERSDRLAVDLGRRTAEERIARLILNLMGRLARRGMTQGRAMEFPLRQHHIADATGLTPVHVSKVLTDFRRRGLVQISDRSLEIIDESAFRRIADIR